MRAGFFTILLLLAISAKAQFKDCNTGRLTFKMNPKPVLDTIGDLVLKRNTNQIYLGLNNLFIINQKFPVKNVKVSGAEICKFKNDKTFILKPHAKTISIKCFYKGDTISKYFDVVIQPATNVDFWFGNKKYASNDTLIGYKNIDSLSLRLDLSGYQQWMAKEDFQIWTPNLKIFLVRDRRLSVDEIHVEGKSQIYIGDLLKKAKPGDRITVEYSSQIMNNKGEKRNTPCIGIMIFYLGSFN